MPRGFGIWLLWLAWALTGILVLQVDAPGAVPGASMARYLTFGYRFSWYLLATIVALYVTNTLRILSTQKIVNALAWFFVMLIGGGVLGLLAPWIDFPSLLQSALPHSLATNSFVADLTHVRSAQIHSFLGEPQARPSAPFPYTNVWGCATAVTFPFFLIGWWNRGRNWRLAMLLVLPVACAVIVASLNRGMWLAILSALGFMVLQAALQGRVRTVAFALLAVVVVGSLLLFSPLGSLISARLATGHSDQGRENLAGLAAQSAAQGSPILGFGSTRNVAGTFSSIAGGASDACPGCESPPLGTHGQLWLVIFGAGFVGAILYVGFLASQVIRNVRATSPYAVAALAAIVVLLVTLPFYTAYDVPLYVGFIAIGILARESRLPLPSLRTTVRPVIRQFPVLVLCGVVGAGVGLGYHVLVGAPVTATQRVLVPAAEFAGVPGVRVSTLDTEAMLVTSDEVTRDVSLAVGISPAGAREGIRVGAEPNTRVLLVRFASTDEAAAVRGVEAAVSSFLSHREEILEGATESARERYTQLRAGLDVTYRDARLVAFSAQSNHLWNTLAEISRQWAVASETLSAVDETAQARAISAVTVATPSDYLLVRVASGFALGMLLGVPLALAFDRRRRIGATRAGAADLGQPVVARLLTGDIAGAARTVRSYAPVAGVVADPTSTRAVRLASRLDSALGAESYAGTRALLLVDPKTRAGDVDLMTDRLVGAGLQPVGLMVCGRNEGRARPERPGQSNHGEEG